MSGVNQGSHDFKDRSLANKKEKGCPYRYAHWTYKQAHEKEDKRALAYSQGFGFPQGL